MTLVVLTLAPTAGAQVPFEVLHEFTGYSRADGPEARLIQATDGDLYGTTLSGGAFNRGSIFKMTSAGVVTVLHSFSGPDGQSPRTALVQAADGNFYGTTDLGACSSKVCGAYGTIFRMTPAGDVTLLHEFRGSDGFFPSALVQLPDGVFYGT